MKDNFKKKILSIISSNYFHWTPDRLYLQIEFYLRTGRKLNLKNPKSFNEKLQWLKLYDRNPIYTTMVDKYAVKEYVADKIGGEYIVPTIGVYDSFDDIDFDKLPNQFVIKCTHDSGGLVICKDKTKLNIQEARKKISRSMKRNYYYHGREWAYKDVKPRIIIEEFLEDKTQKSIRDYKFFCFDGEPKYMYISEGLEDHATAKMCFFNMEYKVADIQRKDYRRFEEIPKKPEKFQEMKKLSRILSAGLPHARIDWYEINGKVYFGEITFFTCSGMIPFETEGMDKKLGDMLRLPLSNSKGIEK